tara:strand:- start:254 stop:775 length:522 start_codon:yes stop_codon:yes gene_type:complete
MTLVLQEHWTWVSIYLVLDSMGINDLIPTGNADGDFIKSQHKFAHYYVGYGYFGTLNEIAITEMYKVLTLNSRTVTLTGRAVELPLPVALNRYWNWISCPSQHPQSLQVALRNATFTADDVIKSQTLFARYYSGHGWYGLLQVLSPGDGYELYVHTDPRLTFTDDINTLSRGG